MYKVSRFFYFFLLQASLTLKLSVHNQLSWSCFFLSNVYFNLIYSIPSSKIRLPFQDFIFFKRLQDFLIKKTIQWQLHPSLWISLNIPPFYLPTIFFIFEICINDFHKTFLASLEKWILLKNFEYQKSNLWCLET